MRELQAPLARHGETFDGQAVARKQVCISREMQTCLLIFMARNAAAPITPARLCRAIEPSDCAKRSNRAIKPSDQT
ncbi:MAG: hypothetical protein RR452_08795, partial [Clostridia bacterium]